jgi:hypothetical protein
MTPPPGFFTYEFFDSEITQIETLWLRSDEAAERYAEILAHRLQTEIHCLREVCVIAKKSEEGSK